MHQRSHYVILDRSDPDAPVWALTATAGTAGDIAARPAGLDETGQYDTREWADVIFWTTTALMRTVSLRRVPGNPGVFRVEPVEDDPQRIGSAAGQRECESDS